MGRRLLRLAVVVLLAITVLWAGAGWYYAGEIGAGALTVPPAPAAAPSPPAPAPGAPPALEVTYDAELGPTPAWLYPGEDDTWAVFVHGKGSGRDEVRRVVVPLTRLGVPTLAIAYRNDADAPGDGAYGHGADEWRDVSSAVSYAAAQGAEDVVLVGSSMGGAIVTSAVLQGTLPLPVRGLVLDSPSLDLEAAVEHGAAQRELLLGQGLPTLLTDTAEQLAAARFGIDWGSLDYVARADELDVPVLLFHGDADRTVPVSVSDGLARARPDLVSYRRVAGAGHVDAWDVDRSGYEAAVEEFVRRAAG